jgi:RHS repeat-associated protein
VTATRTSYTWNRDKQLTSVQRPDGALLSFNYDNAGRLATVAEPLGTHTYSYDGAKGTLSGIASPDGSVGFTYDGDLPTAISSSAGPVSASVGFSYDSSFHVTGETVNGKNAIAFGYDNDDLLVSAGALTLQRDPANGLLTGTVLGNITDAYTYNTFGEPTSYSVNLNGATVFTLGYTRDDTGRIAARTETVNGTTTLTSYTYDDAGRLTDVNTAGANIHYGYDANGNRTSVDSPTGTIAATYDAQDRLITYNGASYFYSDNGELQKKIDAAGTTTYSYDVFGTLRHVTLPDGTLIEYVIDAMNRRVGKKVNGTLVAGWIYSDALHIVAETDGTGVVTKRFIYGSRSNAPDYVTYAGVTYRIVTDERGSVRYVLDASSGTVAQALTYDAFGNVLIDTNPSFQPLAFAGGLYDAQTRLTRFGARDYDPIAARWTTKDPIRFRGGTANLYGYTFGDPVNLIDVSGRIAAVDDAAAAATIETLIALGLTVELAHNIYEQYRASSNLEELRRALESRRAQPVQKHMSCPRPNEPRQNLPRKPPEKPQPPVIPSVSINENAKALLEGIVKYFGTLIAGDQGMEDDPVTFDLPDWLR